MEDACQLLTFVPCQKNGGMAGFVKLVRALDRFSTSGTEDVRQFFIRQTVNTQLGNSDAHLKNFSVLYQNGIMPELSPANDIVCVAALPGFKGIATNMAVNRLKRDEMLKTYIEVAKKALVSE